MKRKVHLVQVNDVIGNNVLLPLAIGILWQSAMARTHNQQNWELGQIVYKQLESPNQVEKLAQGDLVVFSHYVWNSNYQFELAKQIKKINPNITVLVGGPNISPEKKDFWQEHRRYVDVALVGEGDHTFSQLLESWPEFAGVPGAWTTDFFNGEAERVQQFGIETSPYLAGFYDDIVANERAAGRYVQAVIQTNRGCPYHCTFCEEGRDYKNKMFFYDKQRIIKEIEWCAQKGIEFLNIADDNWGIVDTDVEYMRWIRDCKLRYGYPELLDATFAKNNPDNLLAMAEIDHEHQTHLLRGITIALQSQNSKTLSSIRRFNLIPEKQQQLIVGLKKLNVPTYVEMIWPLPYETYESFMLGIDQTIDMELDNWLGVYPLSMHQGTELYNDFRKNFSIIEQSSENANRQDQKETVPIVYASEWANTDTIVKGQVFYCWLVCLFYFGFGRNSIMHLKKHYPVTVVINHFIEWTLKHPGSKCCQWHVLITQWWQSWLTDKPMPKLSIYDEDTTHWSPYTHMASWLQHDWDEFYKQWQNFLAQEYGIDFLDQNTTIRYGQEYAYLNHKQPKFANEFEFCRFYYWWRRKKGLSRLK